MGKENNVFAPVSLAQAKEIIKTLPIWRAVHLYGPPGIGKTTMIEQLAEEEGRTISYVDLTDIDPTEIRGDAYVHPTDGLVRCKPTFFPVDHSILFLDEFTSAMPTMQAEGNKIAFSRRMGHWKIPDDVRILFAGNKPEHKAIAYAMPSHVANKLCILDIQPDLDAFVDYGMEKGFHPDVLSYVSARPSHLCSQKDVDTSGRWPSPRQWEAISEAIKNESKIKPDLFAHIVSGFIGTGVANEFFSWRKVKEELVPPSDIVDGKVNFQDTPNRPDISFANLYSMLFYVRGRELTKIQLERVAEFGASLCRAEFTLVFYKHFSRITHQLTFTKGFLRFYAKHKEPMDQVLSAPVSVEYLEQNLGKQ